MAEVSAADVKKLRDATAAGMLDCKNSLIEANGDFEEAQKILSKKGLAAAGKRSGRATNEGAIFIANNGTDAIMFEMTCETAFVAQNELFKNSGNKIAKMILDNNISDVNEPSIQEELKSALAVIKENMLLKRLVRIKGDANSYIAAYQHDGGSIGALVQLQAKDSATLAKDEVKTFGFEAALHVAAFNPLYLDVDNVDQKYKDVQLDVFTTQAKQTGKPDNIIAGIVQGKLSKHYSEVCFLKQAFVKDDKLSVEKALAGVAKNAGEFAITDYKYLKVGQE